MTFQVKFLGTVDSPSMIIGSVQFLCGDTVTSSKRRYHCREMNNVEM